MNTLEEKLKSIPSSPGVYIMKDADDKVLYVGKAVSLSNFGANIDAAKLVP